MAERSGARVVAVNYRQISAARNAGAAQAQGDLLVFVDADTDGPGTVVNAVIDAMQAGAVGGGAKARFDGSVPIYGRILEWLWLWIQRFGNLASGCFLFCTRQAFEAAGEFNKTLYAAEDVVLSRRLKRLGRFVILQGVVVTSGRNLRSHSGFEDDLLLQDKFGTTEREKNGPLLPQRHQMKALGVCSFIVRDQGVGGSNPLSPTNLSWNQSITSTRSVISVPSSAVLSSASPTSFPF
jgi:hypothetical protein